MAKRIVEDFPFIDIREMDINGGSVTVSLDGKKTDIAIATVGVGQGAERNYFVCPECNNKYDLLRYVDGKMACIWCHDLVYACQMRTGPRNAAMNGQHNVNKYLAGCH